LLVTEMKNQDPTAQTDPNAYVNQLVQVNSLEQLIEINQNLSTALVNPGSGTTDPTSGHAVPATTLANPAGTASSEKEVASHPTVTSAVSGNLSVPHEMPAAHRIAQALSGRN
jgi:flagellar basal-body rod modification protein FlgD